MFVSEKLPALFKKGVLKLVVDDDGERRIAEATLVVEPFTPALARELGEEIAEHLFDSADEIRGELEAVDFRVRVGLQVVHVHRHGDLDAIARLEPAGIKDVAVERKEKDGKSWLALSFVVCFPLESRDARNFLIDDFGKRLYWTFMPRQLDLLPTKKSRRESREATAH